MTKQIINVGATANDRNGDSLRAAFQKVNTNFTELYTALGLDVAPLNLGAFEFVGSTLSTTDSTPIVIDQSTTITSNLTVGGDILPSVANGGDLGSLSRPWNSLYISNNTIYLGGIPLSLDANNNLTVNGLPVTGEPSVTTSATAPTSPSLGDLWYDTVSGRTYVYYGSTWVDASPVDGAGISSTNELVNGASSFRMLSDGTLTLTHPAEPALHPLATVLTIQKAAGNYHTISGAYGLSLQATPVPSGSGLNTNTNFVDIFHDGISVNVNDNTWTFNNDGDLTLPDSATVAVGDIGVLQGLELAYDNSREQLNAAFAAYSYEGDGWPAGPNSYNALLLSTDPAIQPAWIPLAQSVRTAWLALESAMDPISLDIQVAGHTWNFSNAGDFSVPGNKAIKGFDNLQLNVDGGGGKTAVVEIDGYNSKVLIKTTTPGAGISDDAWTFGDAGELTLPVGGVIQTLTTPQVGTGLTDIPGWIRADTIAKTAGFWMDTTPQSLKDAMDATGLVDWQFNPDGSADYYTVLAAEYVEDNTILELTFDVNLPLESAPYSVTSPNYSARTSSNISIIANENEWTFDTDGQLTVPGQIRKDGSLYLNSGGVEKTSSVVLQGEYGRVFIRTIDGLVQNEWYFKEDGNITFPDSTVQSTAWTGITGFGEGFSLTAADKIVTNKLYSTNLTQPTQHYRLELDTNGVVVLPDGSIINGSTIRGVAGTGELNYTGITIGPDINDAEKTWVWVDHANAYVSTNNAAHTWTFGNDGSLTFPNGDLNIVGNKIRNVNVVDDLSSGSEIEVTLAKTVITNGVTNSLGGGGPSLTSRSIVDVGDGKVVMAYQVINDLGGSPTLTAQKQIEVSSNNVLIGQKTINTVGESTLTAFSGWTFDDANSRLTLPADSSILTNETVLNIATHSTATYTFNQAYWEALNGNAARIFTPTFNAQYFSCTVTANQDGTYTAAVTNGGVGFVQDNWFRIPGNELGGTTPANDMQINVATVNGSGTILTTTVTGSAVSKQWQFDTTGSLTLPDNSVIASYKPVTVIAATTTTQTISDSASAAFIQFVDTVDTANAFSTGTFTVPYTGYYQVNLSVYFSSAVALTSTSFLLIDINLDFTKQVRIIDGNWSGSYLHYSTVISAATGDDVRIAIRQVSGGDVDIISGSRLTIHRVSIS
jgi:hypothetical protein